MTTKDWVDLAQAISVLIGIWVAIAGLGIWRQEFISKRRIELAESWLASAYAFRDAIRSIRNPASWVAEGGSRPKMDAESNDDPKVVDAKNRGYVFFERYERHSQTINDFGKMKYQVMARFGSQHEEIYKRANRLMAELSHSANTLARHWRELAEGWHRNEPERAHITRAEDRIWAGGEPDEIEDKLRGIVEDIEKVVKGVIDEKYTFADILNAPFLNKRWNKCKTKSSPN